MKHIALFETFNADKGVQYLITIPACQPDQHWDNPGNWTQYDPSITVTLDEKEASMIGTLDLFSFEMEEHILKAIERGSFGVDLDGVDVMGEEIEEECFGRNYLMRLASDATTLEEFADEVHENLYDFIRSWYRQNYAQDGDGVNYDALREIMFDLSQVSIKRI